MGKCEVCEVCDSKYRCPSCRILYCSVACYKSHKDKCEKLKEQRQMPSSTISDQQHKINDDLEPGELTNSDSDDEDKVSRQQLSLLENSKAIKDMLENDHLRSIIKDIDGKDDPENELESAMNLPLFAEFTKQCLKVVDEKNT